MATQGGKKLTTEEKIAALLKKAETTTPAEAELLTAKAEELMLKYGIDRAMLNARTTGDKEWIEKLTIPLKGIYAKGYMDMMYSIALAYGNGIHVHYVQWRQSEVDLVITGFESDVAQLKVLLASLQLQAVVALDVWWRSPKYDTATEMINNTLDRMSAKAMDKFKARRQFIKSFGKGAAARIRATRERTVQDAESATPGTALVLRDRALAVDEFVKQNVGKLKTAKSREKSGGYNASLAGYAAGKSANTGDKQVSNQRALNS